MKGTVFNIQRFSIQDGPGIRTTVFMKGCPLRCLWCHNPESGRIASELFYDPGKCIGCGRCVPACTRRGHAITDGIHTLDRSGCTGCGECAEVCPASALELCGREWEAADVIAEVLRDKPFYGDTGGMTLSGGEPMLQVDFTLELLRLGKEAGLHICMETCGYADPDAYRAVSPYVDLFLYDYKETDPIRHKEYTGVSNERIRGNLRMLDELGAKSILRCPIIPTLNDRADHFEGIAAMAESLANVQEIHIEPYHPLGKSKAERLGKEYALESLGFPEKEEVARWIESVRAHTSVPVRQS